MSSIVSPSIDDRMDTLHANDVDRIWKVWNLCSDHYLRHGIKLSFPKNTDPTKTYQWRYCRALADKFDGWGFDEATASRFIDLAIDYAKRNRTLRKGLAIFHKSNMLDTVYNMLGEEIKSNKQNFESLRATKKWFDLTIGDRDPVEVLMHRDREGALRNITQWYQANKLTPRFMALSKSCLKSVARIHRMQDDDEPMLPGLMALYGMRSNFGSAKDLLEARKILGDEWRELCL